MIDVAFDFSFYEMLSFVVYGSYTLNASFNRNIKLKQISILSNCKRIQFVFYNIFQHISWNEGIDILTGKLAYNLFD